jgi:hypothetical protein
VVSSLLLENLHAVATSHSAVVEDIFLRASSKVISVSLFGELITGEGWSCATMEMILSGVEGRWVCGMVE